MLDAPSVLTPWDWPDSREPASTPNSGVLCPPFVRLDDLLSTGKLTTTCVLPTRTGFAPVVVCFARLSAERGKIRDHFDFIDAAFELAWAWNQWAHNLPNSSFRFKFPDMGARWTPPGWLLSPTEAELQGESYLFASLLGNAIDRMGRLVRMAHDLEGSITVEELLATASNASTRWLEWLTVLNIVLITQPVPSPLTCS